MTLDEETRVRLGANPGTSPDVLRALAVDRSVTVRASLAMNPALPEPVTAMLASDSDQRVRAILGRRLSGLTPGLDRAQQKRVQRDAIAKLTALVEEAGLRVREKLSEAVRDMPDGPRQVVLRLASDPAVMVSEPVILFSPMLTSDDLVSLIASGPPPSTLGAVARRARIDEAVSDAIVGASDDAAICALLGNRSAQIREATLDALAAQSEEHPDWQEPMVRRPVLSARAARTLSEIVSAHLLETLATREDIDPKLGRELRAVLGPAGGGARAGERGAAVAQVATPSAGLAQASALKAAGKLDDAVVVDALRRNALVQAKAMLAVAAGVPMPSVDRAADLRSAKGIVSLCWRGGLSMQTAVALQTVLARLSPNMVLRAGADGGYPLSPAEMTAQLGELGINEVGLRAWTPRRLGR